MWLEGLPGSRAFTERYNVAVAEENEDADEVSIKARGKSGRQDSVCRVPAGPTWWTRFGGKCK